MIKFVLQSNINESSSISALANFWSCPLTPDPNPWWIKLPSVFGSSGIATKSERFKCGESTTICCCNSTGIAASASWTGEHRKYWEVLSSHILPMEGLLHQTWWKQLLSHWWHLLNEKEMESSKICCYSSSLRNKWNSAIRSSDDIMSHCSFWLWDSTRSWLLSDKRFFCQLVPQKQAWYVKVCPGSFHKIVYIGLWDIYRWIMQDV